jgi:hypothetical protein
MLWLAERRPISAWIHGVQVATDRQDLGRSSPSCARAIRVTQRLVIRIGPA